MSRNHYMKDGIKVHPALTGVYATAVATKKALTAAMAAHRKAAERLNSELVKLVNIPDGNSMIVGSWECPTSPVKVCIYDADVDGALDDCIYCHEPSDRK